MTHPETPAAVAGSGAEERIGTTIAGRYKVEGLLGAGGMGAVYLVQHTAIRRKMALKVLRPEMLKVPEVVARFEREAMAAANIDHPNVAAATDYGRTEDGGFFLVLEFVEGQRLREVLQQGALTVPRALHIARQVASALLRAHELDLVHRDLKPENIMLTRREGRSDFVKVLDFGLVRLSPAMLAEGKLPAESSGMSSSPKLTQAGSIFGTPAYMAPEQALSQPVDIRTDLYALGVILYEMLAGRHPFDDSSVLNLIQDHLTVPPPPFKTRAPGVAIPASVETLVQRLLAKSAADRFADPGALLAAMDQLDLGESPSRPPAPRSLRERLPALREGVRSLRERLPALRERLPAPLKRAPTWLLLTTVSVGAITPVLLYRLGSSPSPPKPARVASRPLATPSRPVLAPASALTGSIALGPKALEALATQYPSDPQVLRALAQAYLAQHRLLEALRTVGRHAALDPETGRDRELVSVIVAGLQGGPDTVEAAVALVEKDLGEAGVELLYDLTTKQTQVRWKSKVNQSLTKPEVLAKATPATRAALELRSAKTCAARAALLPRIKREGGERALVLLKAMEPQQGCGFLGLSDCWSCLRQSTALPDAVAAIEARLPRK